MKATGIVRRFDDLGRIVIPKEIRRSLFGNAPVEGMPMEIFIENNDTVILKKYEPVNPECSELEKIKKTIDELENLKKCYRGDEDAEMKPMSFEDYLQEIIDNLKAEV